MSGVRLLVVDDEASLLNLLRRYLARQGYEVDIADNPADALDLFASDPDRYACILTDLGLPGMTGEEMLQRMRALRPNLPAVVSSGYPHVPQGPNTGFVQKPYLPAMLVQELTRILEGKGGQSENSDGANG